MEQVKSDEFNLKRHEIHGRLPHNLCTDTIIHKAAYSSCKTIFPVVKQFHACNKSDHLQLRRAAIMLKFLRCLDNVTSWIIRLLFGKVSLEKFAYIGLYVKISLCGRKHIDEYTVN